MIQQVIASTLCAPIEQMNELCATDGWFCCLKETLSVYFGEHTTKAKQTKRQNGSALGTHGQAHEDEGGEEPLGGRDEEFLGAEEIVEDARDVKLGVPERRVR